MKTKPDIVVVGGGPCGSYAAYIAAKLGAEVVVCEEHERVGAPKHCAGHLNISSLKRLGLRVPLDAIENKMYTKYKSNIIKEDSNYAKETIHEKHRYFNK